MTFALNDTSATELLKWALETCEKMMYLSNSERSIFTTRTNENERKIEFVNIFSQDGQVNQNRVNEELQHLLK